VLTLHPLSSASLIAIEYGSHDTGKFIVIVFGNDASRKRWSNDEPGSMDAARDLRYECVMVQFS
jgi:hypothetical protein